MTKKTKPAGILSPCVDVCKYKRDGHCSACSMTKAQKKLFKEIRKSELRAAFIEMLEHQQARLGHYHAWSVLYENKLAKKREKTI